MSKKDFTAYEFVASAYTDLKVEVLIHRTQKSFEAAAQKLIDEGTMEPGPSWAFCEDNRASNTDIVCRMHLPAPSITFDTVTHECSHVLDSVMARQRLVEGDNEYVEEIRAETLSNIIKKVLAACRACHIPIYER